MDVYIQRLRRKIDDGHAIKLLHTVRGVGYVLRETLARPLTLQSRVALGCALLVTLALLLPGLGVWILLYRETVGDLDTQLRSVATEFFIQVERHGGVGKVNWTDNREILGWLPTTEPRLYIEIAQPHGMVLYRSENVKDDSLQASARILLPRTRELPREGRNISATGFDLACGDGSRRLG